MVDELELHRACPDRQQSERILSPLNIHPSTSFTTTVTLDDEVFEPDQEFSDPYSLLARQHYNKLLEKINAVQEPGINLPLVSGEKLKFLQDPATWVERFISLEDTKLMGDENYLMYVIGLLDMIVVSDPYGRDREIILSPIHLLNHIITEEQLSQRLDPMRTALRLQHRLSEFAQLENDKNCIYDREMERLAEIPRKFAVRLMNLCTTPNEVAELMKVSDPSMFEDVLNSKNKQVIASKFYQKIVWKTFWGFDAAEMDKKSVNGKKALGLITKLGGFLCWNIFFIPLYIISKLLNSSTHSKFFSPISSYLADLINYGILIGLMIGSVLTTIPEPEPVHQLILAYRNGSLNVSGDERFRLNSAGQMEVAIAKPNIPPVEIALWVCVLGRILTEFYQAVEQKGASPSTKIKRYFASFDNLNDIILVALLLFGIGSKLYLIFDCEVGGVFVEAHPEALVISRRQVLTIYVYSAALVFAQVHFLQLGTIHIPFLGPMMRAMRRMMVDIVQVIFLFFFFICGFITPMLSMVMCYRAAHSIDGEDDDNDFYAFNSVQNTILTLVWGMFGGLAYNHKEDLYKSSDQPTVIFMSILLVVYAVILGLIVMNFLIAAMCNTYNKVTANKSADWRFGQFESIMEYNATSNDGKGMPFIFPLSIIYIVITLGLKYYRKKTRKDGGQEVKFYDEENLFAQFLCEFRLKDPETREEEKRIRKEQERARRKKEGGKKNHMDKFMKVAAQHRALKRRNKLG
eukprot:sb/3462398/